MTHRVTIALLCATLALTGCARHPTQAASPAPAAASELSLCEAAGARLTKQSGARFRIHPSFVTGHTLETAAPTIAQRAFIEAFRRGAGVAYADTLALHISSANALPEDERSIYALSKPPSVRGDTGFVDIFYGEVVGPDATANLSFVRYVFYRGTDGIWQYVRRLLLYAT
jgi:hypothetical protein